MYTSSDGSGQSVQASLLNNVISILIQILAQIGVPTSAGNHRNPGKKKKSSMHGKIMEFEKN